MTEEEIIKGFWFFKPDKDWPPKSITNLNEYVKNERLNLNITQQVELSNYEQSRLVKKWCEVLPKLSEIKYIWFTSKVNQKTFDAVCKMQSLEGIWIKWSGIKNIENITKLKSLKHFHLGSSSQIEDISALGKMDSLKTLELENLKNISDFNPISKCSELKGLAIEGSIWTTQLINDLKPIKKLKDLKYLSLMNTSIKDGSLTPLLKLKNLKRFDSSLKFPPEEINRLKSIKSLEFGNVPAEYLGVKTVTKNRLKWW